MQGHLVASDGSPRPLSRPEVERLIAAGEFFWLDLVRPDAADFAMLREAFGFHHLAVEDTEHFGQRPKREQYDDFVLLVFYGVRPGPQLVEVHCFYAERFLVTVHHGDCPDLTALGGLLQHRGSAPSGLVQLYRVVDALVDSFFPVLAAFDDDIDRLEDAILQRPSDEQLGQLFDMKRALIAMRKVAAPERDMFAGLVAGFDALPGMTPEAERYFRDVYDHLIRVSELIDSYRDLLTGAMDTHLSTVSNRLNVVMKQLTIIATVFLPLSFLTGFFGQNFSWLVDRIQGLPVFVGAGIGLEALAVVGLLWMFKRRGWLSGDGTATVPVARPGRHRVRLMHRVNGEPSASPPGKG